MKESPPRYVTGAVEGLLDEAVLRRLVSEANGELVEVHGKRGKAHLASRLKAFNNAAQRDRWIVLMDLDDERDCPKFRRSMLRKPSLFMCFRIVVREIETWLLADRERIAAFSAIPISKVPRNPESIIRPKEFLIDLARKSRSRQIRSDLVPEPGSGRTEGPTYTGRLTEFVQDQWRPDEAEKYSESLRRCRRRLQELIRQ